MSKRRGNGEGSTGKRKDGRYWARTPSPERRYFYGRTLKDAIARRAAYVATRKATPSARRAASQTFGAYFQHWYASACTRIAPNTASTYETVCRVWIAPILDDLPMWSITSTHVQQVIDAIASKRSPRYTARAKQVMHSVFADAEAHELIPRNPASSAAIKMPKMPRKDVPTIRPEHVRTFLAFLKGNRYEALMMVYLFGGLRRGEALALTWDDVDFATGSLRITKSHVVLARSMHVSKGKSNAAARTVPLPADAMRALGDHRRRQLEERMKLGPDWTETPYVFTTGRGTPLWPTNVSERVKKLLAEAGLPVVHLHALRHTAASLLLAGGVDIKTVQRIIGHASAKMTLDTYGHCMPGGDERAREVMGKVIGGD
jgi:integrase